MKEIQSAHNPTVQALRELQKARGRREAGLFIAEGTNLVDLCRNITDFYAGESCGKCIPCRWGLKKLVEMLDDMLAGSLGADAIVELEELAAHTSRCALCPLGAAGPAPLLSVLNNFRAEFTADLAGK